MKLSLPLLLASLAATTTNGQTVIDNAPFADGLTAELYGGDANECTSSLGVSMAMSLVYPSAISDSETELRSVFGYPADSQSTLLWDETTARLTDRYQGRCINGELPDGGGCNGQEPTLEIANSVFVDDDIVLNATYAAVVGELVQQLDFESEDAESMVNAWVNESTNGLIDSIVEEGDMEDWIAMAINSIYLKASWANQFNEDHTNTDAFLSTEEDSSDAHFMNQVEYFMYSHDVPGLAGYQVLQHSFAGDFDTESNGLSMIFALPPVDSTTTTMATSQDILTAIPSLMRTQVALALPKFRFESTYKDSLKEALQSMGAEAVFDEDLMENLCIQDESCNTFIDVIIQKTLIDVNEKGVEAAAVTAIGMSMTSMPPPEAVLFLANRPFQFFLYDEVDNVVLFEGMVANPGIVEGSAAPLAGSHDDEDFWSTNFGIAAMMPETCPVPGEGICTMEYLPVICGDLACEYSNACGAGLAGFDAETECSPKEPECPVPGEGICTMEYLPVLCGDLACEYDNACNAGLAGFDAETECSLKEPECPVPGEGICTMEYLPVLCGDLACEYDNACNAGLAGFDAETECSLKEPECPVPGEGICTMEYMPVVCGDLACEYDNACNAGLAGFDAEAECSLKEPECPVPGEGICTMEYMPVVCGDLACEYDNACNAGLAGFDAEAECSLKEPECPIPSEGACTMEYLPVVCGDLGCEYDNACNAGLAGFDAEADCSLKEPECPVAPAGKCSKEYVPVLCGDLDCEYDNACIGALAGFDEGECSPKEPECPVAEPGACSREYVPVLCGDLECKYDNGCIAALAGFDANAECKEALESSAVKVSAGFLLFTTFAGILGLFV